MILLAFVVLALILLISLGRFVSPRSTRQPVLTWSLGDYGTHLRRGLGVFAAAGQRNASRMDRMHEEASRKPGVHPQGLRIVEGPLDESEHDPRRRDPDEPLYDPTLDDGPPAGPRA